MRNAECGIKDKKFRGCSFPFAPAIPHSAFRTPHFFLGWPLLRWLVSFLGIPLRV